MPAFVNVALSGYFLEFFTYGEDYLRNDPLRPKMEKRNGCRETAKSQKGQLNLPNKQCKTIGMIPRGQQM